MENILNPNPGCVHRRKRLGNGQGSKRGGTSCRGRDGQRSRSGKKSPYIGFEGGQVPLYRRIPKRGFYHQGRPIVVFHLGDLVRLEENGIVNPSILIKKNRLANGYWMKILADGEIDKKLEIHTHFISRAARKKIEDLDGVVHVL